MTEFKREERYMVIKHKKLLEHAQGDAEVAEEIKQCILREVPKEAIVNCVVVEADWPEYERVWDMLEARMEGMEVKPDGYAYRYQTFPAGPVTMFNDGSPIDGISPFEAVPYYFVRTEYNAEFLAYRLNRVARLVGYKMPDMNPLQISEVAGTILGEIARRLEKILAENKTESHNQRSEDE